MKLAVGTIDEITIPDTRPRPVGYQILLSLPKIKEQSAGGVFIPEKRRELEETAGVVGYVVELGPDAYADPKRTINGPYCKVGDFVIFKKYSGVPLHVDGTEMRLVNDDTVLAVTDHPEKVQRI